MVGHESLSRGRLAGAVGLLVAVVALVAVVDPFDGRASGSGGVVDNGAPTGLQKVVRRSLIARTPVSGTLGYAGSWTVAIPAGTPGTDLQQAEQQVTSARASYTTTLATASGDEHAFATAAAALQAARLKAASDCAGANAATQPPSGDSTTTSPSPRPASGGSPCASSMQTVTDGQATVATVQQKLAADRAQLAGDRTTLASARQALDAAQSAAPSYAGSASYTILPGAGKVIRRGQVLYAIDGSPTLLLYGLTPAWRRFAAGMSPGRDVAELNANLVALGYGAVDGDTFTNTTERAVAALQRAHGVSATGTLRLGSVVFKPAAVRVSSVGPTLGQGVQPGQIMTVSSTRHDVSIPLDASRQSQVKVGDRVLITLPDNSTTSGVVSSVGRVVTSPSISQNNGSGGGSSTPTIEVDVRLLHPAAAGTLDRAPVNVLITTAVVSNALVVPVNALIALARGGYAVEEVTGSGTHELLPVTPGLFDDLAGLVQVTGNGLAPGQRVVVPASA